MRNYQNNPDGSGNGPFSTFLKYITKRLTELQFYDSQTVSVEQTTRGTKFHVKPTKAQGGSGQVIYMQVCKADGSSCYVALQVLAIVAGAGTGTVEATIPPGTVIPTGATVII